MAAAWRTAVPPRVSPVLPPVPPLFGQRAGVAVDQRDAPDRDAELLGGHLRDGDAHAGADVDLARVDGDAAVGMDGEEAVDFLDARVERRAWRCPERRRSTPSARRAGRTRSSPTVGAVWAFSAARRWSLGLDISPARAHHGPQDPRMRAAPAQIPSERLLDLVLGRAAASSQQRLALMIMPLVQ